MAEIREAVRLQPGDYFIWATNESREYVRADTEFNPHRLQVLKVTDIQDEPNGKVVGVQYLNGSKWAYFVTAEVLVAVITEGHGDFHSMVRCNNCGDRFGDHYCGDSAFIEGICCKNRGSGDWFVPNETYLRHHHKFPSNEEFFAELGL